MFNLECVGHMTNREVGHTHYQKHRVYNYQSIFTKKSLKRTFFKVCDFLGLDEGFQCFLLLLNLLDICRIITFLIRYSYLYKLNWVCHINKVKGGGRGDGLLETVSSRSVYTAKIMGKSHLKV